ncbi:MAG: tryptophan 7-halogenase [Porticoccaceae bacterium]|nr:tryptophan 7-halogenase [Porticoccaceae bacterium]
MKNTINRIVIVGGGTAGWLSAGIIAAEHFMGEKSSSSDHNFHLVLIESPDIPTIGVGEGTWPSMRSTLKKIGISETDFIRECSASFKQGTEFHNWVHGKDDTYTHPFTVPHNFNETNLAPHWQQLREKVNFANAVNPQSALFDKQLAPKNIATPEYSFHVNYGYHLDAGKFANLLRQHCVETLGVEHISANMTAINSVENGDISSISTDTHGDIQGDLFIDCSGSKALLLGEHYGVPLVSKSQFLFNNCALATQIPYQNSEDPIQSATLSTAQAVGWIWDIGLPTRRGVGHIYSSDYTTEERARSELLKYIAATASEDAAANATIRKITFDPGHREKFWHKNCVAIGMSSGFIEPLEASALVLVELSAAMIAEQLPANRKIMDLVAKRFNEKFLYRWDRIVDFLKLHYVLTQRTDSQYWIDNCDPSSIPESLQELMDIWQYQSPWHRDNYHVDEMFPSASFQYILYGMDFKTQLDPRFKRTDREAADKAMGLFMENAKRTEQLVSSMPTNRELINKIYKYGFQKI